MTLIKIVPFEEKHIKEMSQWQNSDLLIGFLGMGLPYLLFTAFIEEKIIAIAGVIRMWEGVAEAMSTMAPEAEKYMKSIHRKSKEIIIQAIKDWKLRRVQTVVNVNSEKGRKWVEALGFKIESTMSKYGLNGEDILRYVMFPNNPQERG